MRDLEANNVPLTQIPPSGVRSRPRGLANNVEALRSLRVESPDRRAAGNEESVPSIISKNNEYCNLSRGY